MSDRAWIGPALRQRCKNDENWSLPRRVRWWVTARTVLAIVVGAERPRADDEIEVAVGHVHATFHPDFGSGGEFDYLGAPRHGWGYGIESAGWP